MRKPIVYGNWKMNMDRAGAVALVEGLKEELASCDGVEFGVAPPFVYLEAVVAAAAGSRIGVASQNVYFEEKGAFTGEISVAMLRDVGCDYAIIGHSERRHVMGESDELINKKVRAALAGGLKVILCVGELADERDEGKTEAVVDRQIAGGLHGVDEGELARVVIAYEPVWAIGTGRTATPEQAGQVHAFIRRRMAELYSASAAEALRIQYGGSVKPENAYELARVADVDGALVGGASLKKDSFAAIVAEYARAAT